MFNIQVVVDNIFVCYVKESCGELTGD